MGERELLVQRRRLVTRAFIRYFLVAFFVVAVVSTLSALSVLSQLQRRADRRERRLDNAATLLFVCEQLEALKTQNREDVTEEKRQYKRNLRLLHLADTPELRRIAEAGWAKRLERNKARACPYAPPAPKQPAA